MFGLNLKQKLLGAAAGTLLLGLSAQVAHATPINSILTSGNSLPLLSDNSAEYLINIGADDNTVDVGDRLRGILSINTIENPGTTPVGSGGNPELTALFDVTVTGKVCAGAGTTLCSFTFGATPGFAAEAAGLGFANVAGAAIAFFEDDDAIYDFTRVDGIAAGEASATDGDPFWLLGFDGVDDFWSAFAFDDDITAVPPPPGIIALFNAGLSLLDNPFGIGLNPLKCGPGGIAIVDACGSGGVIAPDAENEGFDVWDNVDFTVSVPEPASLSLFGLGLLGLGYRSFRRNRRQKKA